jgi:hypothetical protein
MRLEDEVPTPAPEPEPEPEPTPEPTPVPGEPIVTMFDRGQMKAFLGDYKLSDSPNVTAVGGYYRNGMLTAWLECQGHLGIAGTLILVPQALIDVQPSLFKFGGVGKHMRGAAHIRNEDGQDQVVGVATWGVDFSGRAGIVVQCPQPGANAWKHVAAGVDAPQDWPWSWHYGLRIYLSIPLP